MIFRKATRPCARKTIRPSSASSSTRSRMANTGSSKSCRKKKRCSRPPANSPPPDGSRIVGGRCAVRCDRRPYPLHQGPHCPLWWAHRAQPSEFRGLARRDPRDHWAERRRKEHVFQLLDRSSAALIGTHFL